jgi:uncharacterized membrane protein YeaQ/YmgE (transglycosylase-associated protein family)
MVWIGMTVGSVVGGYIPALWGAGIFDLSSIILGGIGAVVGIYLGYKMSQ